jgi:hypothetical protein
MSRHLLLSIFDLRVLKKALGISLFVEVFYLLGYYFFAWPFPSAINVLQIMTVVFLGIALGVFFSMVWPISSKPGLERVVRTIIIVAPSLGLGIGLQLLLQGNKATHALYMIFAVSSWLGSGHFVRCEEKPLHQLDGGI